MKSNKSLEKLLGKIHYKMNSAEQDKFETSLEEAWQCYEKKQKALPIFRTLQKKFCIRYAKLAAVVTVTLVGLAVSIVMLEKSTPQVYALEQTVEAVEDIRYFHFRYIQKDPNTDKEAWVEYDRDGQLKNVRVNFYYQDSVVVWRKGITQNLKKDINELSTYEDAEYTDKILFFANRNNPGNAIEYFRQLEAKGDVRIDIKESDEENDPILVTVTYEPNTYLIGTKMPRMREVLKVDPITRFLSSIDVYVLHNNSYVRNGTWEYLDYNQPFEPGIFKLENEIDPKTTFFSTLDLELGIKQGKMSEQETVYKITNEFLNAWKSKHYDRASKFHGYVNRAQRDNLLKTLANNDLLQILKIGQLSNASAPMRGYTLSCILQIDSGSKSNEANWDIHVRKISATRWCIGKIQQKRPLQ